MNQHRRRSSITARLFLAVGLPASLLVVVLVVLTWFGARGAVLESLERELKATAAMGASRLNPDSARFLMAGDTETRTYKNLVRRLGVIQRITGSVRVVLLAEDELVRADGEGVLPIFVPAPRVALDRKEFQEALAGQPSVSVPFKSEDGRRFLAVYAKVPERDKKAGANSLDQAPLAMVLALEAPADALEATDQLATYLAVLCLIFIGLVFGLAFVVARTITFPLLDLAKDAGRLAEGELTEPLSIPNGRDEVNFLAETLESMRVALSERDTERQMMLAGIAHEVRNPLGGMELFSGLLEESLQALPSRLESPASGAEPHDDLSPELREELLSHVARVRKELRYLTGVVNDFLKYARETHIQREEVKIRGLLEDVKSLSHRNVDQAPMQIDMNAEEIVFPLDAVRIKEALLNLVSNALNATPPHGQVTLRAFLQDEGLCLEVEDTGEGMSPEIVAKVFTPFFTTREKGSGLGLPLVQKFARDHQGHAEIRSELGKGTTISLVLNPGGGSAGGLPKLTTKTSENRPLEREENEEMLLGDG